MSYSLKDKSRVLFAFIAGFGVVMLAITGALFFKLYTQIAITAKSLIGQFEAMCGCQAPASFSDHPWMLMALFGGGILGGVLVAVALIRVIKLHHSTARFVKMYISRRKSENSSKLWQVAREINLEGKIIEIDYLSPVIFCYGFFHPRICVSSTLIERLTNEELRAALLHEQHHLIMYEPLKFFIAKAVAKAAPFAPGIRALSRQYLTLSELAADERASNNFQNKMPLARALAKIIEWQESSAARQGVAISFLGSITEERVNKLIDSSYAPKEKGIIVKTIVTTATLAMSIAAFSMLFDSSGVELPHQQTRNCALVAHTVSIGHEGECGAKHSVGCSMSYAAPLWNCEK